MAPASTSWWCGIPLPWLHRSTKSWRNSATPTPNRRASKTMRSTIRRLAALSSCPSWWPPSRRGIHRDITRLGSGAVQFYRVPGHLLEVTDLVEKMQKVEGGLFQASLDTVMYE